jgi:hypothetical protein
LQKRWTSGRSEEGVDERILAAILHPRIPGSTESRA